MAQEACCMLVLFVSVTLTQRSVLTFKSLLTFRLGLAVGDALSFLGLLICCASSISLAQ